MPSGNSTPPNSTAKVPVAVGSALGVVALLVLIATIVIFYRRRRRVKASQEKSSVGIKSWEVPPRAELGGMPQYIELPGIGPNHELPSLEHRHELTENHLHEVMSRPIKRVELE